MIKRALLSVTDKSGLVEFARGLAGLGVELISTGGTAKKLAESGLQVTEISAVTGFPEMLDGRVKTLHPAVHGGLLAMRSSAEHMAALERHGIRPIDLVVVNLYQFEKAAAQAGAALEELIENIDIGGPSMIRSAAKNHRDVAVVVSPGDYPAVLEEMRAGGGAVSADTRWRLAKKAFAATAAYDTAIAATLERVKDGKLQAESVFPPRRTLVLEKLADLRYGENPHQQSALYHPAGRATTGLAGARQLQGKELSYNNLVDLDAAWELVQEFEEITCAIIKHTNPCGLASASGQMPSYQNALSADPVSAFGGVLAFNRPLEADTAAEVSKLFVEAIAAPGYTAGALEKLAGKKNLRLMEVTQLSTQTSTDDLMWKQISGGLLLQTKDSHRLSKADLKVVSERAPSPEEERALMWAWKACKHVKSNAIVYAREGQIVGVGAGQMSRVDSVKIGAARAVLPLQGTVLASDAFFPFPDGIEEAAKHGITAVIQPGGSVRDPEVITAANHLGLAMVFTGVRHFRH